MLQICMMSLPFSKFAAKENLYFQGKMCLCQFSPCSGQIAGWLHRHKLRLKLLLVCLFAGFVFPSRKQAVTQRGVPAFNRPERRSAQLRLGE